MEKLKSFMLMLLVASMSMAFTACGGDDDEPINSNELGDYYIEFAMVDQGTLTASEATSIIGSLNSDVITMDGYTYSEATYTFNKFMKELADALDEDHNFTASIAGILKKDKKEIDRKTLVITRTGCTLR